MKALAHSLLSIHNITRFHQKQSVIVHDICNNTRAMPLYRAPGTSAAFNRFLLPRLAHRSAYE
jgi:hypothetical protein